MAVHKITKSFVDKRAVHDPKNGSAASFYFDADLKGFGIKCTPAGHKSYFVQYRVGRGRKADKVRQVIGEHGSPWTPDTARDEAGRILSLAKLGDAPIQKQRADRTALTVADICAQYLEDATAGLPLGKRGKPKKPSTLRYDRGRVERHILPLLGRRLVKDLTTPDIQKFVNAVTVGKTASEMERTESNGILKHGRLHVEGGAGTAARAVQLLGGILTYAKGLGVCASNPVHGVVKAKSETKDRWLSAAEFKRLGTAMAAVEAAGRHGDFVAAVRLIALTGARKGEILKLRWDEVDLDAQALMLGDTKTGKSKRPLGRAAADILRARAIEKAPDAQFVFESRKKPGAPMVGLAKAFERITRAAELKDVSPHTLRHSLATHAADMGFAEATVAAVLGHRLQSVTSRYTHQIDATLIAAADKIADRILRMLEGRPLEDAGQVIELRRA